MFSNSIPSSFQDELLRPWLGGKKGYWSPTCPETVLYIVMVAQQGYNKKVKKWGSRSQPCTGFLLRLAIYSSNCILPVSAFRVDDPSKARFEMFNVLSTNRRRARGGKMLLSKSSVFP